MNDVAANISKIKQQIPAGVILVAVSKTKPVELLQEAYKCGIRDFGENKVQELCTKQAFMPTDVQWHLIGHLQTNKVKYIAPFIYLIHSVDSWKLLQEINKQAAKHNRVVNCLLQIYIASEETKFGLDKQELMEILTHSELQSLKHIRILGLMGMASNTSDESIIQREFKNLKQLFDELKHQPFAQTSMEILSMGMSGDYALAIAEGSTMIRVGSSIFGSR
ncbi:MAG: YggS family pyridoxal phosphate-dependent enzyme [Bacteroidota bacterium]